MAVKLMIKDPIYYSDIFLFMSPYEEFTKYMKKKYNFEREEKLRPAMYLFYATMKRTDNGLEKRRYYLWMHSFGFYTLELGQLAHEIDHLVIDIFDRRNIKISAGDGEDEAFCYFVQYLYTQFIEAIDKINRDYKPCKPAMEYMKEMANEKRSV